jgi:hypothetical protein
MANTGAGLEGTEFEKFQDYIHAKVCKWYSTLDPILKNRPNIYPVWTNQDESDDDSVVVETHASEIQPTSYGFDSNNQNNDVSDTSSSSNTTCYVSNNTNSSGNRTSSSGSLSPYQANNIRKSILRDHKKNINIKGSKSKTSLYSSADDEEREYLMECRKKKLELEERRDTFQSEIEAKKIKLEADRLQLQKIESELKRDNIKLMNTQQSIISEQEKNKLLLLKLEVYEKRKEIIKNNPEITEAMLDELMPLN